MKCIWCDKGVGSNRTKNKDNIIYYYVCENCVGFYIKEQDKHAKELLEEENE